MSVRVVIVDDQAAFRQAAQMVVAMTEQFEVVGEATDGEEAVGMVASIQPDLALMDVNLPGIDGLEATRRITHATPAPVVLVLSTYESDDYADRALEAGAAAFISKSALGPDVLVAAWRDATAVA